MLWGVCKSGGLYLWDGGLWEAEGDRAGGKTLDGYQRPGANPQGGVRGKNADKFNSMWGAYTHPSCPFLQTYSERISTKERDEMHVPLLLGSLVTWLTHAVRTTWLPRLSHRKSCSFHLGVLECLLLRYFFLEPSHRPHGGHVRLQLCDWAISDRISPTESPGECSPSCIHVEQKNCLAEPSQPTASGTITKWWLF